MIGLAQLTIDLLKLFALLFQFFQNLHEVSVLLLQLFDRRIFLIRPQKPAQLFHLLFNTRAFGAWQPFHNSDASAAPFTRFYVKLIHKLARARKPYTKPAR